MTEQHPFKWRHFQPEIILLCALGLALFAQLSRPQRAHAGARIARGSHDDLPASVQRYAPELDRRCRPHLKAATDHGGSMKPCAGYMM